MRTLAVLAVAVSLAAGIAGAADGRAAAGPTATAAPAAIGAPIVGQRVTAEPGAWTGSGTVSLHYQWYRCDANVAHCSSVHGATGRSYRIVSADVAHTLALTVTGTDPTGKTSAYASAMGPVVAATAAFASTVQPSVTASATAAGSLAVDAGVWTRTPSTLAYAWLRCNANGRLCAAIPGATANTYATTSADTGHALVALVTATSAGGGAQATLSSAFTRAPTSSGGGGGTGPGPAPGTPPTVAGQPVQGARLTATAGTWSGTGTISYGYQWYRCDTAGSHCSSVHGATAAGYTLVPADVGHTIALTVTAKDAKGATPGYASLVGPIAAAGATLVPTIQPAVTGTASVGQTLTVSTGSWSTTPTSYAYGWQRCNANGRVCAPISGATSSTYTVTAADRGHRLLATVQATAGNSTGQSLSTALAVP